MEYKVRPYFWGISQTIPIDAIFRDPATVKNAYTENSIWRNRDTFLKGHEAIVDFLTKKWAKENGYRLRKELFAFQDNKVSDLTFLSLSKDCSWGKRILAGLCIHPFTGDFAQIERYFDLRVH